MSKPNKMTLIPDETRLELEKGARGDTDFYWTIADRSIEVMASFLERKDTGEYPFALFSRSDVWSALSHCCCKSPGRIRVIAQVGAIFQPAVRCGIEMRFGFWEFGYYEQVSRMPATQFDLIFQFLLDYEAGELVAPGRRLGVGEFIFLFEKHILGLHVETVTPDDSSIDLSQHAVPGYVPGTIPFQDMIRTSSALRKSLLPHQEKGGARMVLYHLNKIQEYLPLAMKDCGVGIEVDIEAIKS